MVSGGKQCDQIMMWWSYNPQLVTARTLDSIAYLYIYYLALPDILILAVATTQVHPPTWASPVSDPGSPSTTRGHSPTWASLVSVPSFRIPTPSSPPFRFQFLLHDHIPNNPPPPFSFTRVFQGDPSLFFCRLLVSPRLPPALPSFLPFLPCTHLK